GCRRWMNCEAPRIADVGDVVVKLQRIDELAPRLLAASQLEANQAAVLALEVSVCALAMNALLLRRVNDPLDFLSRAQEIDHGLRILAVLAHAQCQSLQPLDNQERIERRQRRADIAQ